MNRLLKCLMVLSFIFFYSPAFAQTPDGQTPANEGVCDGLIGLTPGLYGLCVAFCEAQDCEATFDPATGDVTFDPSCKPSSAKLLRNYDKRVQPGDPPMPCLNVVESECPCWTQPELDQIADSSTITCGTEVLFVDAGILGPDATGNNDLVFADADFFGDPAGVYFENTPPETRIISIEPDQLITCIASIEAECTARGF